MCSSNGHLDIVRFLVEVGTDKGHAANSGATTLLLAAQNGHLDIVRFLVEVGTDKDQAANSGATTLLLAARNGHLDIVRFLVEVGTDNSAFPSFFFFPGPSTTWKPWRFR